ncbi:MAG: hypothetical protein GQ470_00015 [Gammaproteobacteria bacterium]|nr:hypothetical protein [Gammaproteobacteria bacterium]
MIWPFIQSKNKVPFDIFIGNIPPFTTDEDIRTCLLNDSKDKAKILFRNKEFIDGGFSHFCIVSVDGEQAGNELLEHLQTQWLNDQKLSVHRYVMRHLDNENRTSIKQIDSSSDERRSDERRRNEVE